MVLRIPASVVNNTHNANTFAPYDPNAALGDVSPTTPTPQAQGEGGGKCGTFGKILLAVVAVAIQFIPVVGQIATAVGGAIGSAVGAVAGATIGGAVGSFAAGATLGAISSAGSQAFGLATGIQDKFSWKAVGTAAISGGIGGGSTGNFVNDAINGAINNATVQGIAVVTGLQKKFDFAGVAAAGIGAGVGGVVSRHLDVKPLSGANADYSIGNIAENVAVSASRAIANAATRSSLTGESFGDSVVAAIPDVIGQTVGSIVGNNFASKLTLGLNKAATTNEDKTAKTVENGFNVGGAVTEAIKRKIAHNGYGTGLGALKPIEVSKLGPAIENPRNRKVPVPSLKPRIYGPPVAPDDFEGSGLSSTELGIYINNLLGPIEVEIPDFTQISRFVDFTEFADREGFFNLPEIAYLSGDIVFLTEEGDHIDIAAKLAIEREGFLPSAIQFSFDYANTDNFFSGASLSSLLSTKGGGYGAGINFGLANGGLHDLNGPTLTSHMDIPFLAQATKKVPFLNKATKTVGGISVFNSVHSNLDVIAIGSFGEGFEILSVESPSLVNPLDQFKDVGAGAKGSGIEVSKSFGAVASQSVGTSQPFVIRFPNSSGFARHGWIQFGASQEDFRSPIPTKGKE